ncbi:MAG: chromosomal replication initiator protein DnaA [Planctomycetaceae bacterium]
MQPNTVAVERRRTDGALREKLQDRIGTQSFNNWFQDGVEFQLSADRVVVGCNSPFMMTWLKKRFRAEIQESAVSVLGPNVELSFEVVAQSVAGNAVKAGKDRGVPTDATDQSAQPRRNLSSRKPRRRFADMADFVVGPSNELAWTAAQAVGAHPGRCNPLFLHGGVGLGKTHLLEGIYRALRRNYPACQLMFLTAEEFANHFTKAMRERSLPSFRHRFRSADILIVDDVDFLNGKMVIQEEFLHTFKQLESYGRQLILASDQHPRLFNRCSDELITRFLSGGVYRIERPELETRIEIAKRILKRLETEVTREALKFVAQRFVNSVRELEGALHSLSTYSHMTGNRVGLSAAQRVLADLERDCVKVVRVPDVERVVCRIFGVAPEQLRSASKQRSVSQPRMLAMFLARKHTDAAYSEIGRHFGRNHSTVVSAQRRVEDWIRDDVPVRLASGTWPLKELVDSLEHELRAG